MTTTNQKNDVEPQQPSRRKTLVIVGMDSAESLLDAPPTQPHRRTSRELTIDEVFAGVDEEDDDDDKNGHGDWRREGPSDCNNSFGSFSSGNNSQDSLPKVPARRRSVNEEDAADDDLDLFVVRTKPENQRHVSPTRVLQPTSDSRTTGHSRRSDKTRRHHKSSKASFSPKSNKKTQESYFRDWDDSFSSIVSLDLETIEEISLPGSSHHSGGSTASRHNMIVAKSA